jgi:Protein of unknown function (DUF3616)
VTRRSATGWGVVAAAMLSISAGCRRHSGQPASQPGPGAGIVKQFDADVYGASGVVQLPDGRILIVEDDQHNPLALVDLFGAARAQTFTPRQIKRVVGSFGTSGLNDLEAATIDGRGHVYASTSHALAATGAAKPEREQLIRFDVKGSKLVDVHIYTQLKAALSALDPKFAAAAQAMPEEHGGLNIEGLAWDSEHARLLIGFRNPRHGRRALVVWLQNPDAVFDEGAPVSLLPAVGLDLGGEGVRDLTYSRSLQGFVIVAGSWGQNRRAPPTLWLWDGTATGSPVRLNAPILDGLKPEGVADVGSDAGRALLIVSDDGSGDEQFYRGRAAENNAPRSRYALLPIEQLRRDNPGLK